MSHVASVQCFVTDLADARAGGLACGFMLMENQTAYESYSSRDAGACEHALRLFDHKPKKSQYGFDHDYEIGLKPRADGQPGWELFYDNFSTPGQRLEAAGGKGLSKLKDEIAAAASMRVLQRQGYRVTRTLSTSGEIQLLAQR